MKNFTKKSLLLFAIAITTAQCIAKDEAQSTSTLDIETIINTAIENHKTVEICFQNDEPTVIIKNDEATVIIKNNAIEVISGPLGGEVTHIIANDDAIEY